MPPESTVRQWVADDREGFAAQYASARVIGYHAMADELLDIADGGTPDVNRARLQVDARKWLLSKALPKVYGDRFAHEHGGPDGTQVHLGSPAS